MTTIAYRDGILAGDTQVTGGNVTDCTMVKIARNERGDLAGACGSAAFTHAFLGWFSGGEKHEPPTPAENEGAMIVRASGEIENWEDVGHFVVKARYYAIGSGRSLATGAMAAGASAEQAIGIAMRHDIYTGGDVTTLSHNGG